MYIKLWILVYNLLIQQIYIVLTVNKPDVRTFIAQSQLIETLEYEWIDWSLPYIFNDIRHNYIWNITLPIYQHDEYYNGDISQNTNNLKKSTFLISRYTSGSQQPFIAIWSPSVNKFAQSHSKHRQARPVLFHSLLSIHWLTTKDLIDFLYCRPNYRQPIASKNFYYLCHCSKFIWITKGRGRRGQWTTMPCKWLMGVLHEWAIKGGM